MDQEVIAAIALDSWFLPTLSFRQASLVLDS
jgi:hypothetical protein